MFFFFLLFSLLLSFSGWSLGAQRLPAFTYLPRFLRPERENVLHLHSLGRPGGHLWPPWTEQAPCLGALLAFSVNQGISASFSPLFLSHSFICQRRFSWGFPWILWGLDPINWVTNTFSFTFKYLYTHTCIPDVYLRITGCLKKKNNLSHTFKIHYLAVRRKGCLSWRWNCWGYPLYSALNQDLGWSGWPTGAYGIGSWIRLWSSSADNVSTHTWQF